MVQKDYIYLGNGRKLENSKITAEDIHTNESGITCISACMPKEHLTDLYLHLILHTLFPYFLYC
jgi:hypothetical protein